MVAELSLVGRHPARDDVTVRIAEGEDGVGTTSLAVSASGSLIATTDTAGRVAVRDEEDGWRLEEFTDHQDFALSVAFAPDGRFLAIGGIEFGIALWHREGDCTERSKLLPQKSVSAMAFSPDGLTLAAAGRGSTEILLWDVSARREKMILTSQLPVLSLAFSPDGRYLASGERADRASIYVWELATGRARLVLEGSSGSVVAVAFSPDGATLATAALYEDGVRLWDLSSSGSCRVIAMHSVGTSSVAFSPDGSALAAAGTDGTVRLWSVATGEPRAVLDGRSIRLNRLVFSQDGRKLIATGLGDNNVRFWELTDVIPFKG
jgi:WD40 repeat protein